MSTSIISSRDIADFDRELKQFNSAVRSPISDLFEKLSPLRGKKVVLIAKKNQLEEIGSTKPSRQQLRQVKLCLKSIEKAERVFDQILNRFQKRFDSTVIKFTAATEEGTPVRKLFKAWGALSEKKVAHVVSPELQGVLDAPSDASTPKQLHTIKTFFKSIQSAKGIFQKSLASPEIKAALVSNSLNLITKSSSMELTKTIFNEDELKFFIDFDKWLKKIPFKQKGYAREIKNRVLKFVCGEEKVLDLSGLNFNRNSLFKLFKSSSIEKLQNYQELNITSINAWIKKAPKNQAQNFLKARNKVIDLVANKVKKFELNALEELALRNLLVANRHLQIHFTKIDNSVNSTDSSKDLSSKGVSLWERTHLDIVKLEVVLGDWVKNAPTEKKNDYTTAKNSLADALFNLTFNENYRQGIVSLENYGLSSLPDIFRGDIFDVSRIKLLNIKGNSIKSLPPLPECLKVEGDQEVYEGSFVTSAESNIAKEDQRVDTIERGSPTSVADLVAGGVIERELSRDLRKRAQSFEDSSRSSSPVVFHGIQD